VDSDAVRVPNPPGVTSRRISVIGAWAFGIIFAGLAAIELSRGWVFVALLAAGLGAGGALYSLIVFVRVQGEPQVFAFEADGLVLHFDYLFFRREMKVGWNSIKIRVELLRDGRVRLRTFQRLRMPRWATLEMDRSVHEKARRVYGDRIPGVP